MRTIVIIPAKNEAAKIAEVIRGIVNAVQKIDILVVDDGSSDATSAIARQAGALVVRHRLNRGQGASIKTGVEFALRRGYDTAVFFDADGQMSAAEIPLFLEKINEGYEVVLGSRNLGQAVNMPTTKRILKRLALWFTVASTSLPLTDTHNGFQAWRLCALAKISLKQDRMAYASELLEELARTKLKYCEVPVTITYSDYAIRKGQRLSGSWAIIWDLIIK